MYQCVSMLVLYMYKFECINSCSYGSVYMCVHCVLLTESVVWAFKLSVLPQLFLFMVFKLEIE